MAATTNIHGFNIGGNNNSFDQRGHFYRGVFSGNVTGMLVKQNSTPNMTVLVEHGSALLNKNTISASIAEIKSDTSVTIDTANTSNPRIDTIVIYEDTSIAIPTVENNYWQDGAGGRFKIVSLPGTAAASPIALSDANIQTAIGAGKPWTRLADVTVPTNSTTIINSNIADKRKIVSPNVSNYGTAGVLTTDASGSVTVQPNVIDLVTSVTAVSGGTGDLGVTSTKTYSGTQAIKVSYSFVANNNIADNFHEIYIKDNNTTVGLLRHDIRKAGIGYSHVGWFAYTPTSGSHTIKLSFACYGGSLTTNTTSTSPIQMVIERC